MPQTKQLPFFFFLPKYGISRGSERVNVTSALLRDNVVSSIPIFQIDPTWVRYLPILGSIYLWHHHPRHFCDLIKTLHHQDHVSYSAVMLPSSKVLAFNIQVSCHLSSIVRDQNSQYFSQTISIFFKETPVSMISSIWNRYRPHPYFHPRHKHVAPLPCLTLHFLACPRLLV